jgi:hypothetical protein
MSKGLGLYPSRKPACMLPSLSLTFYTGLPRRDGQDQQVNRQAAAKPEPLAPILKTDNRTL